MNADDPRTPDGSSGLGITEDVDLGGRKRVAVHHEVFDDDGEMGEWKQQRDTVRATHIRYGNSQVVFEDRERHECLMINADNFLSAWTEGANE